MNVCSVLSISIACIVPQRILLNTQNTKPWSIRKDTIIVASKLTSNLNLEFTLDFIATGSCLKGDCVWVQTASNQSPPQDTHYTHVLVVQLSILLVCSPAWTRCAFFCTSVYTSGPAGLHSITERNNIRTARHRWYDSIYIRTHEFRFVKAEQRSKQVKCSMNKQPSCAQTR